MSATAIYEHPKLMPYEKFLSSLNSLEDKIVSDAVSFRELKAYYFSLNLDYIRLCEGLKNGRYFPSRNCDLLMKGCTDDNDLAEARRIVKLRIREIKESLR